MSLSGWQISDGGGGVRAVLKGKTAALTAMYSTLFLSEQNTSFFHTNLRGC